MPYSKKQMKIARMAPPRNKITGADFAMLKQKKKKNGKKNGLNLIVLVPKLIIQNLSITY